MVKTRKQIAEEKEPTLSENRQAAIQKRWAEERSKKEASEGKKTARRNRMKAANEHRLGMLIISLLLL